MSPEVAMRAALAELIDSERDSDILWDLVEMRLSHSLSDEDTRRGTMELSRLVRALMDGSWLLPDPIATVRARYPRAFALPPGALCSEWSIIPHADSSPLPSHIATGATEADAWAAAAALVLEQP